MGPDRRADDNRADDRRADYPDQDDENYDDDHPVGRLGVFAEDATLTLVDLTVTTA